MTAAREDWIMHVLGDWSLRYDVLSWGGGPAARVCWPASTQPHFLSALTHFYIVGPVPSPERQGPFFFRLTHSFYRRHPGT